MSTRRSRRSKQRKKNGSNKSVKPSSNHQQEISPEPNKVNAVDPLKNQSAVSYDENLLERTRTQWQFGDWQSLAQIKRETLQHHPDRAKLALLASAGLLQIGKTVKARQFVRLARNWGGSKKLVCQILVASIHNSLACASMLIGQQKRALEHFKASIAVADPGADIRLLTEARINQQCTGLGFMPRQQDRLSGPLPLASTLFSTNRGVSIVRLAEHKLGDAWAGNTSNTVIFRHHGILSHKGKQITAFYVDEQTLRLVQRDLEKNTIQAHDISGNYNLCDAHNSISLGVDRADHLHICYDHHVTKLRYRRSIQPNDITTWTDEISMTGKSESKVTYPTFILPHHGFPLTLLYRDGTHDNGIARMKTYNEDRQIWEDHPQPILRSSDLKPWASNAYWNHPAIGSDGSLHLSFVWRTHTLGKEDRINNINIGYACSSDNGISWSTSLGRSYQLPITPVNAETLHPVSPGSNFINQCSMALDSRNRPHIVFYADDSNGIPQYQHLRYDGRQWHHQVISQRTQPFTFQDHGTPQMPVSQPEIVIDQQDNAYIIARGDHSQDKIAVIFLDAPNYMWAPENTQIFWDEKLGFAEPVIDRERWAQDNVLSLLLQYNEPPNHDFDQRLIQHSVRLVDIQFNFSR